MERSVGVVVVVSAGGGSVWRERGGDPKELVPWIEPPRPPNPYVEALTPV